MMKLKFIFLGIIFCGLAAYYVIRAGWYPVASVNGKFLMARQFNYQYNAAIVYYQNFFASYPEQQADLKPKEFLMELRRATLDKLVENILIYGELKKEIGRDLAGLVARKIPKFEESAALVYGLQPEEFKELVLEPQARREILEGRLFLKKQFIDEWLEGARQNASVMILSLEMQWNGHEVISARD